MVHDAEILPKLDLEIRKTGIGSSEVAAIVGLNPYTSAFDVYLEKTGKVEPFAGNEATRLGKRMERPILEEYTERTGKAVQMLFNQTFVNPTRKWQLASPDGLVPAEELVVEAKNVGSRMAHGWGEEGTDQVPPYYLVQVCWQLSAMNLKAAEIAALIAGNDFKIYAVPKDLELEEMLLSRVDSFWRHNVQDDIPPEAKDTERTREYIREKFSVPRGTIKQANSAEEVLCAEFRHHKAIADLQEKTLENIKTRLRLAIGNAEGIEGPFGTITWRAPKPSTRTDWEGLAVHYQRTLGFIGSMNSGSGEAARQALDEASDFTKPYQAARRLLPKWSE